MRLYICTNIYIYIGPMYRERERESRMKFERCKREKETGVKQKGAREKVRERGF